MELADLIVLSELPEEQQQMAELIGVDNFVKLIKVYGGMRVYIPKPDRIKMKERNQKIREDFDGGNYKQLATKYGLTESHIRKIVGVKLRELQAQPMDGQISLFD